jgi:hypothetical protein
MLHRQCRVLAVAGAGGDSVVVGIVGGTALDTSFSVIAADIVSAAGGTNGPPTQREAYLAPAATSALAVATALGLTASQATSRTPFDADWQAKTSLTRDRMTIDVHFELNSALNRALCGDIYLVPPFLGFGCGDERLFVPRVEL